MASTCPITANMIAESKTKLIKLQQECATLQQTILQQESEFAKRTADRKQHCIQLRVELDLCVTNSIKKRKNGKDETRIKNLISRSTWEKIRSFENKQEIIAILENILIGSKIGLYNFFFCEYCQKSFFSCYELNDKIQFKHHFGKFLPVSKRLYSKQMSAEHNDLILTKCNPCAHNLSNKILP
jgi:hypothetical protein